MNTAYLSKLQATGCPEYFDPAENDAHAQFEQYINPWLPDLNDKVVVEIACGHGRIANQVIQKFSSMHMILVDINPDNIDFCTKRFSDVPGGEDKSIFSFINNNGVDLQDIKDHSVDFVYSFDSMVHFNFVLMKSYIDEVRRILKDGARAFIHFSNYGGVDGASEITGPGIRGSMTNDAMLHLLPSTYKIIHNEVIDWGGVKDLDAIIVFEK